MPLLEALRAQHDFTTTDEVLASYILSHPDEVVRMSVSQLANETYTSSAAVNRLCRKVGSDGFRSFRVDFNTELERERLSSGVSPNLKVSPGEAVTTISSAGAFFSQSAMRYALSCLYATAFSLDAEANEVHRRTVTAPDWDR